MAAPIKSATLIRKLSPLLQSCVRSYTCLVVPRSGIHTSACRWAELDRKVINEGEKRKRGAEHYLDFNKAVYPPTKNGEPPRPAEVCHARTLIEMSPKKLWYPTVMVRGLSIGEAIKQLKFSKKLGATFIREVLEEAQEIAVRLHHVEFASNLWVEESYCTKAKFVDKRSAKRQYRIGLVIQEKKFSNYFVRLREGSPPEHYYPPEPTGNQKLREYIETQRQRRILHSL